MKYLISWICWKKSCFFQIFLKFYFKKLVADIKTWGKNIIKLDSIFVLGASFFPTKRPLFYWLCISRYTYFRFVVLLKIHDFSLKLSNCWGNNLRLLHESHKGKQSYLSTEQSSRGFLLHFWCSLVYVNSPKNYKRRWDFQ